VIAKWKLRTGVRTRFRKSGLERGEYEVQQAFTTEDGNRVFPDVVINLPDGKKDDCRF
jgi:hypothetical protein